MIFFLYPQAVPSRVPTGLFGLLPPQTFGLLLGQSSLTSKGITVHPGIIDSDYKGEIQIMMSSESMAIQKGDQIAQLLLLPYISINSSNIVQTGGFSSTDQKQSLWTSLVSDYARPNINIKINGKRFSALLDTGSDISIVSNTYGPNPGLYKRSLARLWEFLKLKYKRSIKVFKHTHVRDQKGPTYNIKTLCDKCTP